MKLIFSIFVLFTGLCAMAQDQVKWTTSFDAETKSVVLNAEIEEGWHLYSQFLANDLGPIPTEITFEKNRAVTFSEKTDEPTPKESFDKNFGGNLSYFEKSVDFKNKISYKGETTIVGSVLFMVCNESMCMPPAEEKFQLKIK